MTLTMKGRLSRCLLLAYRTPADSVRGLLPGGLQLVTHGPWAFWNIVVCRVEKMRLIGWPHCGGVSYFHAAYRLYVKGHMNEGRCRGLYFVRSDADRRLISSGGNVASDFHFHQARMRWSEAGGESETIIDQTAGGIGDAQLRVRDGVAALRAGSCFDSFDAARAALKYQPLGLSVSRDGRRLKLAEVFRDDAAWRESCTDVIAARWNFLDHLNQHDTHLEMATRVEPIDYRWRLGRRMRLAPQEEVGGKLVQRSQAPIMRPLPARFASYR